MRLLPTRHARGLGLVESLVSMAVLGIALVGLTQLQLVAVGANSFSRKMTQASMFASDLVENIGRWDYDDPRLAPGASASSLDAEEIIRLGDLPRSAVIDDANRKPHYAAHETENATTDEALTFSGNAWEGLDADLDGDGEDDFERYWSVFSVDADGDGVADGKQVVVVVRWREAGLGFRQVAATTFRFNPRNLSL